MANTTTTTIPAEVNVFYDKNLLLRVIPLFVYARWAQVRDIPRKSGTMAVKFRRYGSLSAATTPLSEGVTPVGTVLSVTDITATVAQYGDYITVTDVLDFESPDPVLTEAGEILGDQAGDTLDQLTRDIISAGSNIYYATGTARTDQSASYPITTALVDKSVRLLKNNKARKITSMINATDGVGTLPVNACYIGIIHPNVTYTLKGLTGFVKVEQYGNKSDVMPGEVGSYGEVRFIETTNAKVFTAGGSGSADVYATLIFGDQAYGITRISGEALKNIVKPLGSAGTADPLDQRATSGWKATFVAKILNNDFLVRVECGVAA
jgi:N4-gp56 family major capsid protein